MMEKRCWNCANEEDGTGCAECFAGETPSNWKPGKNYAPPTNADHIRAMDDEEMAENRVVKIEGLAPCPLWVAMDDVKQTQYLSKGAAVKVELYWLRQPWEEDA